jgi:hypothetical protein
MPDVFALSGRPALARMRTPEIAVVVTDDGPDAKASALGRLLAVEGTLAIHLGVIDALDGRIKLRRPLPIPAPTESLQSLVRRGRRRLERERQGGARALHDIRLNAVTQLRVVLEL